jgi:deferrochelatase/peroxidase EfeB
MTETPSPTAPLPSALAAPQAGILNRPPDHLLVVALTLSTADPAATSVALERLRELLKAELWSRLDQTTPQSRKDQPSAESGELGFSDHYDRYFLTVTVGFGKGAYDKLGTAAADRPQDLVDIRWAQLGDSPQIAANGDLCLQICSNSIYIAEHVLRRVEHHLADVMGVTWVLMGHQRHNSRSGRVSRNEGRALIGFLDGTSNLDPRHNPDDTKLVFVDPDAVIGYPPVPPPSSGQPNPYDPSQEPPEFPSDLRPPPTGEPAWTRHGSYMVVRGSLVDMAPWDQRAIGDQEHTIGRFKVSGDALDGSDDPDLPIAEPSFGADPQGATTPLDAHIRKANPRGPQDAARRIFRRGYPVISAQGSQLQRGLVFVCFGRTISTQFEFITRAWTTNPDFPHPGAGRDRFRQSEGTVLAGGYFFVPPLAHATRPWSWVFGGVG